MTDISLEAVSYRYPDGTAALDAIDLHIPARRSLALIGANGSGKSTLARHLDGLLRPSQGRVLVDGADAAASTVAQLARQVGLCFQEPGRQIFERDVRSEVEFGLRRLGLSGEQAFARAKEALGAVGLVSDMDRHPDDLGETRRKLLTIASVLAMRTPVVVLDEPTIGLDARGIELIGGIIADLRKQGRTVIAISHDLRFVAESFERVVVMDAGRVVLDGTPASVFSEDAWPIVRDAGLKPPYSALLGARLGLGSTPTEASVIDALRQRGSQEGVTDAAGLTRIIGRARTIGPRGAITADDPVKAARTARRALADAGYKAVAVDLLIIAARDEPSLSACATLARRALGPHGLETRTVGMAIASDDADELVAGAVESRAVRQDSAWTLAVAIGVGADGTIVALCAKRDHR